MEYVDEWDNRPEEPVVHRRPRAFVAPTLLALFILIYLVMFFRAGAWNRPFANIFLGSFGPGLLERFGALFPAKVIEGGEIFRVLTSAFVHLNLLHLFFNCYCVFSLGLGVEHYYGARRMFVSYVFCTISANLFVVYLSPGMTVHIGTLGGLFGLDGVLLGFALRNRGFLDSGSFRKMVFSALFWPVLWVGLSFAVPEFRGGVEGIVAGFAAGTIAGVVMRAVNFRPSESGSAGASVLFAGAVILCLLGWASLLGGRTPVVVELEKHVCDEGGFAISVPAGMEITARDRELRVGQRGWVFCRVSWRARGPYDELDSLARQVIFDRSLEADRSGDVGDVHLVDRGELDVAGAEGVLVVLSMSYRGDPMLYSHAILIKDERVYTISLYYPAGEELRQEQVDKMIGSFEFVD